MSYYKGPRLDVSNFQRESDGTITVKVLKVARPISIIFLTRAPEEYGTAHHLLTVFCCANVAVTERDKNTLNVPVVFLMIAVIIV